MNAAEGKRMNFYVPAQQGGDQSQHKKKCDNISSKPRRAVRILGRRYALTPTSYKYLDIAISVGTAACVELVLSDNRGNEIVLPIATWKGLIQKREDIERALQSTTASSPLWIRDLLIEFVWINETKIIKFTLFNNSLYMKHSTLIFWLDLENCIDHMYLWLCENTHLVTMKFNRFVSVIQRTVCIDARAAAKAIRESEAFDCESLIDCELLAYALDDIMYDACNK